MGDYAIRMQFDIAADPDTVIDALTSTSGVSRWWSTKVEGSPGDHDGQLMVWFPDLPQPHEYAVERDGARQVAWRTMAYPPWWAGTVIRWHVAPHDDAPGTRLRFSHEGFDPDDEIIAIVTPAWAQIILRLKSYAETGTPAPYFTL